MTRSIRWSLVSLILFILFPSWAHAHPPVSIVLDSQGRIFYSDLSHVWVIHPDGRKERAVSNVHTHELWIDENDVLYGEDVQNLSGDRVRHKVWGLRPDGTLFDHIAWREGYPMDYHDYAFTLDNKGNVYVLNKSERRIEVRHGENVLRTISLKDTESSIHWHTVEPSGRLYIAIGSTMYTIAPGKAALQALATDLIERTSTFDFLQDRHAIMGLWAGSKGSVYVSIFSGQVLKRISLDGEVETVLRLDGEWSPVGGTRAQDGTLYVLEWSTSNDVRIRRILTDGREEIL